MKKALTSLLTVAVLASTVPAWADPLAPTPPPIVTPLKQGQAAPWTGVLLSPPAVAQVVAQHDISKEVIDLAVKHQVELDAAQQNYALSSATTTCTADKTVLQAQVTDYNTQNKILNEQLKKATSGLSTPVWIGIGFAGGVVVTTLITVAVVKVTH
jgi:hypothetical protein